LDVARFPVSQAGSYDYSRDNIRITKVEGTGKAKDIADAIRKGQGVVVIHGLDYNGNGEYDFSRGVSELNPDLPAEATDPAACGVLQ
jgi:coenzyme F420-reducing hydrogenase delta subunit